MRTNFPEQWMTIMRDITQLHELSEQPTYVLKNFILYNEKFTFSL